MATSTQALFFRAFAMRRSGVRSSCRPPTSRPFPDNGSLWSAGGFIACLCVAAHFRQATAQGQ